MRALKLIGSSLLLLIAGVAQAEVSGTVSVTNDYDFRGISQTQRDPALQGSFDWLGSTGWYAGLWGSNVDFGPGFDSDIEVDGYFGYAMENEGGLGWDVGFTYYSYWPDGDDINYPEIYAGFTYKHAGFKVWYTHDYVNEGDAALYLDGSLSFDLPRDFGLGLHLGHYGGDGLGDSYIDWSVGLTRSFGAFDLELKYVDTDIEEDDNAKGRVVFMISTSFPRSAPPPPPPP